MRNYSYSYFTRKQANILFAATKRGELSMSKADIRKMYGLVGQCVLENDECIFRGRLETAIDHLLNDRIEYAQLTLDGHPVYHECVGRDYYLRPYDEENDWFADPDENGMVEDYYDVYEWVVH